MMVATNERILRQIVTTVSGIVFLTISTQCVVDQNRESRRREPMVAFMCGRPSMHWTANGWAADEATGCLKERDEILKYCQKVYGSVSIVDVVESTHVVRIGNWCDSDRKQRCNSHSFFVKPYRCLEYQLPTNDSMTSTTTTTAKSSDAAPELAADPYIRFIGNVPEANLTEHEYYTRARNALRQRHRLKMAKVLDQWKQMNQSAERTWIQDANTADELNKHIATKFQKLYEALLEEEKYEDRQLNELHQQRVQTELNHQKREALDGYMKTLRREPVDPMSVLKALKNYIRTEERDSEHTVSRFIHIRRKDTHEAETVVSYVIEHLKIIDKRIRQSLDMLDRIPKHKKVILRVIEPFLRQFDSLDESIASVNGPFVNWSTAIDDVTTNFGDVKKQFTSEPRDKAETMESDSIEDEEQRAETRTEHTDEKQTYDETTAVSKTTVAIEKEDMTTTGQKNLPKTANAMTKVNSWVKEKMGVMHKVKFDHVAFMQKSEHHLNEIDLSRGGKSIKEPNSFMATPIGMTVFSIVVVMLIAGTLILLHRRYRSSSSDGGGGRGRSKGRSLITRKPTARWSRGGAVSNGYENPTYRYLNAAANA